MIKFLKYLLVCLSIVFYTNLTIQAGQISSQKRNLLLHWDFNEGSGDTSVDKISGNNAILNGGTWVSGKFGKAYQLYNDSFTLQNIYSSSNVDIFDDVTYSFWVKDLTNYSTFYTENVDAIIVSSTAGTGSGSITLDNAEEWSQGSGTNIDTTTYPGSVTMDLYDVDVWTAKDSDRTWTGVAMSTNGTRQTAIVQNGRIYVSTDSGNTWVIKNSDRLWSDVAMSADGSKQTATEWGPEGGGKIYVSADYGASWTAKDSNRYWGCVAMSADGTKQTAGVGNNGQIYISVDSGNTWTAKDSNRNWREIAMSADGSIQAATEVSGVIFVSTDSGNTWAAKGPSKVWHGIAMSADGSYQTAAACSAVTPANIYVSTDSGNTWVAKDSSRFWMDVAMSADGSRQSAVIGFGNSGQIYISTDYGSTWIATGESKNWNNIAMSADGSWQTAVVSDGQIYINTPASYASYTSQIYNIVQSGSWDIVNISSTIPPNSSIFYYIKTSNSSGDIMDQPSVQVYDGSDLSEIEGNYIVFIASFSRTDYSTLPLLESATIYYTSNFYSNEIRLRNMNLLSNSVNIDSSEDWGTGTVVNVDTVSFDGSIATSKIEQLVSSFGFGGPDGKRWRQGFMPPTNIDCNGLFVSGYGGAGDSGGLPCLISLCDADMNVLVSSTVDSGYSHTFYFDDVNLLKDSTYYVVLSSIGANGVTINVKSGSLYPFCNQQFDYRDNNWSAPADVILKFAILSPDPVYTSTIYTLDPWSTWSTFGLYDNLNGSTITYTLKVSSFSSDLSSFNLIYLSSGIIINSSYGKYCQFIASFTVLDSASVPKIDSIHLFYIPFPSNSSLSFILKYNASISTSSLVNIMPTYSTWKHVVVTRADTKVQLYVNGKLYKEMFDFSSEQTTSFPLKIGSDLFGTDQSGYCDFAIDDFAIFNRVLTPTEIRQITTSVAPVMSDE